MDIFWGGSHGGFFHTEIFASYAWWGQFYAWLAWILCRNCRMSDMSLIPHRIFSTEICCENRALKSFPSWRKLLLPLVLFFSTIWRVRLGSHGVKRMLKNVCISRKKKKKKKSFTLFSLMLFSVHFWCITCQKNALITCQTTKYTHSWCVFCNPYWLSIEKLHTFTHQEVTSTSVFYAMLIGQNEV